ncbi:MAG: class I SAM-dependent methyltransferase [Actinomycetota bacterium]|nr:class I SAM-dependent methyltransferase [Actinomycetota bacterium]
MSSALPGEPRLRDTRSFYLEAPPDMLVAPLLLGFARERAGHRVMDFGCAVGAYALALEQHGFSCAGVDVNPRYVARARENGLDAHEPDEDGRAPFPDASFDTVLLFEVLEHVPEYERVLREAKRLARTNVLITVPNCGELDRLVAASLVFDHVLDQDHVNFFTRASLEETLARVFSRVSVEEREYRDGAVARLLFPSLLAVPAAALFRLRILRPRLSYRLFAEAHV